MAPNREEVVESVSPSRRDFLRKLIAGAAFAPPLIASFSMDGLSIAAAGPGVSNQFCFASNATASNMGSESTVLYLRDSAGELRLDTAQPTSATAKFTDSPGLSRSHGNPYRPIGTWQTFAFTRCDVTDVSDLTVWLGLRNSDDQGTSFDLKADLFLGGADEPVASGETICISGVTRNPAKAKAVTISFDTPAPGQDFAGAVELTISARIGTGTCPGHASATGLRLYYDAANRASNFDVELTIPTK